MYDRMLALYSLTALATVLCVTVTKKKLFSYFTKHAMLNRPSSESIGNEGSMLASIFLALPSFLMSNYIFCASIVAADNG
jgi:hypothetical protein